MTLTIWVDDWQMQCCGDPFAPGGDVVSWALMEIDPDDYVHLVGEERAEGGIDFCEEHHGGEEGVPQVPLEVVSVVEVHCRYEVLPGATDRVRGPVPGTTALVPVEGGTADGWAKAREGMTFAGYLVTARRQ